MLKDKLFAALLPLLLAPSLYAQPASPNSLRGEKVLIQGRTGVQVVNSSTGTIQLLNSIDTSSAGVTIGATGQVANRGSAASYAAVDSTGTTRNLVKLDSDNLIRVGESAINQLRFDAIDQHFSPSTIDGADTSYMAFCGGGNSPTTRGSTLQVYGNENGTLPGWAHLLTGAVAGASLRFRSHTDGHIYLGVTGADKFDITGDGLFPITTDTMTLGSDAARLNEVRATNFYATDGTQRGTLRIVSSKTQMGSQNNNNVEFIHNSNVLATLSSTGFDFGGTGLELPNGATIPATCTVGQVYHDTNSNDCIDTGGGDGALCICKSVNTWALLVNF